MSAERDLFARRDHHGELMPARLRSLSFSQMSAYLLTAANVVMSNMPPSDERYPYAARYLEIMMDYVDGQAVAHQMGVRETEPSGRIIYWEVGGHASTVLWARYGSEIQL